MIAKDFFKRFKNYFKFNSFFMRTYLSFSLLFVTTFLISIMLLTSRLGSYYVDEKQSTLDFLLYRAIESTEDVIKYGYEEKSELYDSYKIELAELANQLDTIILTSSIRGEIDLVYDSFDNKIYSNQLNSFVVNQTINNGSYFEINNMYDFFDETYYIKTGIAYNTYGGAEKIVLVAISAQTIRSLLDDFYIICILIIIVMTLIFSFVSFFITKSISDPLTKISKASRLYANGHFHFRVREENSCIEINTLSKNINDMARSLYSLEDKKNDFIQGVSHELKTPLTTIAGTTQGILDGTIPHENQNEYLENVLNEVSRLGRLTSNMVQASRIDYDDLILTKKIIDPTDIISRILCNFEKTINDKKINIEIDFSEKCNIIADYDNLYQVFYNLIENAIKFTNVDGTLSIIVNTNFDRVNFSISNTGEIIQEEHQHHIFDKFFKGDSSRSKDTTGSGLGLYLVRKILIMHDEDISLVSENYKTTFSFSFKHTLKDKVQNNNTRSFYG